MEPLLRHHGCRMCRVRWNGHDVLWLDNAKLRVGILLSKGADIFEFRYKPIDLDVLWHREGMSMPDPVHYRPETLGYEAAFFDHYLGGWQESFPSGVSGGTFHGAELGLHGEVSLLPWTCRILEDQPQRIAVELSVRCRRTPFTLKRRMTLSDDRTAIELDEEIQNVGGEELEYAWGHHPAFGAPFLSPACQLDLPEGEIRSRAQYGKRRPRFKPDQRQPGPRMERAAGGWLDARTVPAPGSGTGDNLEIRMSGAGLAAIRNPDLRIGWGITWDSADFPYLWTWEDADGHPGYPLWSRGYLFAFEPFNCPIGGLTGFAGQGVLPTLAAGETKRARFAVGFCSGLEPFTGAFL